MNIRLVAAIAASVLVAGCVSSIPTGSPVAITDEMRAQIEAGTKQALKDPESARFGVIAGAQTPDGNISVCGMVNAKNSFGGYTGEQPFFGVLHPGPGFFEFRTMGGSDGDRLGLRMVCQQSGVIINI
jgi:hypothetical protein